MAERPPAAVPPGVRSVGRAVVRLAGRSPRGGTHRMPIAPRREPWTS